MFVAKFVTLLAEALAQGLDIKSVDPLPPVALQVTHCTEINAGSSALAVNFGELRITAARTAISPAAAVTSEMDWTQDSLLSAWPVRQIPI